MEKKHSALADLTEDQYRKYFEVRFAEHRLRKNGAQHMASCLLHEDRNPSCSIRMAKGAWYCHSCKKGGGLIDLERAMDSTLDSTSAVARIGEIIGLPQLRIGVGPEAVYQYVDAQGKPLFQVCRFPNKKFMQRKRAEDGSWDYKTRDLKMVLYELNLVIASRFVFIVEGEKDADQGNDDAMKAGSAAKGVCFTTSPRGAGKWQGHFAPYLLGKIVVIIADKDEAGRRHAQQVAESVSAFAYQVKVMEMPGEGVKDYSEWRAAGGTLEQLSVIVNKEVALWTAKVSDSMFANYSEFEDSGSDKIEWCIEGLIELGANGMLVARPKAGKSFAICDLAVALASGQNWLDFHITRRFRVALVSREDSANTTNFRLRRFRLARGLTRGDLDEWLYTNTRRQSRAFSLESAEDLAKLIGDLKRHHAEIAIFDVMRVLHSKDENDNTEMQAVIQILNTIRDEAGCAIILVHHARKGEGQTITEMARGASAIAGWAEWVAAIQVVDIEQKQWVRSFECELKSAEAPPLFYYQIDNASTADGQPTSTLRRCDYTPPKKARNKKGESRGDISFGLSERQPGEDDEEFGQQGKTKKPH